MPVIINVLIYGNNALFCSVITPYYGDLTVGVLFDESSMILVGG